MDIETAFKYASILRCRTWGNWPEGEVFRSTPLEYTVDDGEIIGYAIQINSYENRDRPENAPPEECKKKIGPILWRGDMGVGYKLGDVILKAPEDSLKIEIEHSKPLQGEIDIQFLVGSTKEYPVSEVEEFIKPLPYSLVSFLNILLGDSLVPVAPIQTRKLQDDKSLFTNTVNLYCKERPVVNTDTINKLLATFINHRTTCTMEQSRVIDVSMRRFLSAQLEEDIIDKFCDLWEVCEFLSKGKKVKGTIVSSVAQMLTDHINKTERKVKKAHTENGLNINSIYKIRCDIVHNAVENVELVKVNLQVLNEIANELLKAALDLPYDKNQIIEQGIEAATRKKHA